jgi:hypothetical protein
MRPLILTLFTCLLLPAQTSDTRPEFEVASIKPNHSGNFSGGVNPISFTPGGRFTATNVTLVDLIVRVYPTRRIQMQGGPGWIDSDRFDLPAKAPDSRRDMQYQDYVPMVQMLLEKRFALKMHRKKERGAGDGTRRRQGSASSAHIISRRDHKRRSGRSRSADIPAHLDHRPGQHAVEHAAYAGRGSYRA